MTDTSKTKKRGFASMTPEKRSEIARMGGFKAHKLGRAHTWTKEEAKAAGSLGGKRSSDLRYGKAK